MHWGEKMANTSAKVLTDSFSEILSYAGGTGSVNFYMAHGGTNFGWTAGELHTSMWGWGLKWGFWGMEVPQVEVGLGWPWAVGLGWGWGGLGWGNIMDLEEQMC